VPEDISVVGFDDIELSEYYIPALTTIRQDRTELGRRSAETLLDLLNDDRGAGPDGKVHLVDVELIARASTGPVPA
jgi:LacI family transcriptional regulator, repressor for deo operon, udp, cdd, tsx, nupC, and nupG